MHTVAHIDIEVEHLQGVIHIHVKHRGIGHVPAGLVHIMLVGEIYMLVASLQHDKQQGKQGYYCESSFHVG